MTTLATQLDDAWKETGVAGQVRGLTSLADVVKCQREELVETRIENEKLRKTLNAVEAALRGHRT